MRRTFSPSIPDILPAEEDSTSAIAARDSRCAIAQQTVLMGAPESASVCDL